MPEATSSSDADEDENSTGSDSEWVMAEGAAALLGEPGHSAPSIRNLQPGNVSLQDSAQKPEARMRDRSQKRPSEERINGRGRKRSKGKAEAVFASANDFADILGEEPTKSERVGKGAVGKQKKRIKL